jgi:uncharacterized repeat protein (TIGR01451 family)/LPXTG-motif cell wall-anchored protein
VDALKGWSVTDVLPEGLTLVSMTGPTYTCDVATATCVSSVSLPAGADGQAIEVTAKVTTKTKAVMHNVAYVSPSADEITETNTLVIPKTATDTSSTATDNDAQADLSTESLVSIGDYVWFDTNRDGLQSTGEPVVPGVVVNLYAEDGVTLVSSTTTDEHGFYSFVDLIPGATYVVEFVKPSGSTFTTPTAGDTAADSNADLVTGRVTVVAPAEGNNSASEPDDPTIDAGLVQLNLTLTKTLTSDANVHPGDTVTYSLVPHNDGPVDALAGWSISEVLPAGLTLTDLSGTGYTCSVASATCISTAVLPANADGPAVTVTATVKAGFTGEARNIAYVAPSPDDEDETNPLVIPDTDTDTTASPTDNDAEAPVTVTEERLAHTGADGLQQFALIGGLLFALGALVLLTNRRRSRSL